MKLFGFISEDYVARGNSCLYYSKNTHTPQKFEPPWPGRAGIEQQSLTEPLRSWLVRVAEDADIWMFTLQERPPLFRHLPAFVQDMTDGDAAACRFDHDLGRKSALSIIVHVFRDRRAGRDGLKLPMTERPSTVTGAERQATNRLRKNDSRSLQNRRAEHVESQMNTPPGFSKMPLSSSVARLSCPGFLVASSRFHGAESIRTVKLETRNLKLLREIRFTIHASWVLRTPPG